MIDNKQLNDEQIEKVIGGDAIEDAVKDSLKDQEEKRIKELLEKVDNNNQQRNSTELNDLVDNMNDILKKLVGQDDDDSDGKIHIG